MHYAAQGPRLVISASDALGLSLIKCTCILAVPKLSDSKATDLVESCGCRKGKDVLEISLDC